MKQLIIILSISLMTTNTMIGQKSSFKDDFGNNESLENWNLLEIEGWVSKIRKLKVENGQLVIEPTSSGWFEDNFAGHLYREYTGNFELTTRIKVEGTVAAYPQTAFSLAGLFVRVPRALTASEWERGKENWMFFSTGCATDPGEPQFEIKSTYNSQSTLKIYPAKNGWMELKIVRVDEIFTLLYKFEGGNWELLDQFIRPDLPETLQLGITAYADWPSVAEVYPNYEEYNKNGTSADKGDLRVYVDYLELKSASVEKKIPIANFIGNEVLEKVRIAN